MNGYYGSWLAWVNEILSPMKFFRTLNGLGHYYGECAPPVIVLISWMFLSV